MFENSQAASNTEGASDSDDGGFSNRVPRTRAGYVSDASIDSTHARSALHALGNWERTTDRQENNTENRNSPQTDNEEEQEESKSYDYVIFIKYVFVEIQ